MNIRTSYAIQEARLLSAQQGGAASGARRDRAREEQLDNIDRVHDQRLLAVDQAEKALNKSSIGGLLGGLGLGIIAVVAIAVFPPFGLAGAALVGAAAGGGILGGLVGGVGGRQIGGLAGKGNNDAVARAQRDAGLGRAALAEAQSDFGKASSRAEEASEKADEVERFGRELRRMEASKANELL